MRKITIFTIIGFILFLILYILHLFNLKNTYSRISSFLPFNFKVHKIQYTSDRRPYYIITTSQGEPYGIAVLNTEFLPEILGYSGPINILVILDNELKIRYLKVIHHTETVPQADKICSAEFLSQFLGKSYKDPFQIGKDIDAITGATVTSSAIAKILKRILLILQESPPPQPKIKKEILLSGILLILTFLSLLLFYIPNPSFRYLVLLYTIIFTGFIFRFFITTPHLYNIFTFKIPFLTPIMIVFLFTVLLILLLGKNTFCNSVCPFGAVQQIIYTIRPFRFSTKYYPFINTIKLLIFFILFYIVFLTGNPGFLRIDPFSTLFCLQGNPIAWIQLFLILIGSLLYYRIWCNTICPIDTSFRLISKIRCPRVKIMLKVKRGEILFLIFYTSLLILTGVYLYSNVRQFSLPKQEKLIKTEPEPIKKTAIVKEPSQHQEKLKQKLKQYKKHGITPRKAMYYE